MRFFATFFVYVLIFNTLNAQWRPSPADLFEEAEEYFLFEEYTEALPLYMRINLADSLPAFIRYRVGICYLNTPGEEYRAVPFLEFAAENISQEPVKAGLEETKSPDEALLFLGIAYRHINETEKAQNALKRFIEIAKNPALIERAERELDNTNTAELFRNNARLIEKTEVASAMGLTGEEFNLVISGDESTLTYAGSLKFYDAVFYSKLINQTWSQAKNITPQLGSDGDAYPLSLSYNGNQMLIYRYDPGTNGDIYISRFESDRWTKMELLPNPINSEYYESHASFSFDENSIYFSSNRPGGFGGQDIYLSVKDETGVWGQAVNLGPQINTMGDETSPFISKDGKHLFFSSKGHTNMGGFDVFYSQKLNDGLWSQARNPGYPINSTGDDKFFIPVGDGPDAYYAKQMDEQYMSREFMKVSNFMRKHDVKVNVRVQVKENWPGLSNSRPLLTLSDTRIQKTLEVIENLPESGLLEFSLAPGYYVVSISNDKYMSDAKDFSIAQYYPEPQMDILLELHPQPVQIDLRNVYFSFDNSVLTESEKEKLTSLTDFLKEYPTLEIHLTGYTDISGDRNYNIILSGRRAESILEFLVTQGISKSRISFSGKGPENYIATNAVIEGRRLNRRVEILIKDLPEFVQLNYPDDIPEHLRFKKE